LFVGDREFSLCRGAKFSWGVLDLVNKSIRSEWFAWYTKDDKSKKGVFEVAYNSRTGIVKMTADNKKSIGWEELPRVFLPSAFFYLKFYYKYEYIRGFG
jgi:hypothetical protein